MKRKRKSEHGTLYRLLIGILAEAAILTLLSLLFAFISDACKNPTSLSGLFAILSLILSGAIYGFCASRLIGEGGKLAVFLSSLLFSLVIILTGIILAHGDVGIGVLLGQVIYLLTAVLFSLLGGIRGRRKFKRK